MVNQQKYLHISKIDKDWGFYVTTVGYCKTDRNMHYPITEQHPKDHIFSWNKGRILDGYYMIFITSGSGIFESAETAPQVIAAGSCFFLFPGIWHRYKPDPKIGWEEYWVGFNGEYPKILMNRFFCSKQPLINTGLNKDLLLVFNQLLNMVSSGQIGYPQLAAGITLQLLGLLNRIKITEKVEDNPDSVWVSKVVFMLQNCLDIPVNIEQLVKQFPISYSKFRQSFKKLTGKSANQYHLDLRISKAEELLINTNLTIKEISYNIGFDSQFYFSRLFKKKFGVSPKIFREKKMPNFRSYDNP